MRQLFSNDMYVSGPVWKRPCEIGVNSAASRGGAEVLHPPLDFERRRRHARYSTVVGKTAIIMTDSAVVTASVDDCGWSLPVGHTAVISNFNEEQLTGQAQQVKSLASLYRYAISSGIH